MDCYHVRDIVIMFKMGALKKTPAFDFKLSSETINNMCVCVRVR